jgi:hypothetical protein
MSNDTIPARIYVEPDSCGDGAYSVESIAGSDETKYIRADLVDALVEKIKALPVEHWVQEGPHGEPVLVGYIMQAQGEWDAVNEAIAAIQEKANE